MRHSINYSHNKRRLVRRVLGKSTRAQETTFRAVGVCGVKVPEELAAPCAHRHGGAVETNKRGPLAKKKKIDILLTWQMPVFVFLMYCPCGAELGVKNPPGSGGKNPVAPTAGNRQVKKTAALPKAKVSHFLTKIGFPKILLYKQPLILLPKKPAPSKTQ